MLYYYKQLNITNYEKSISFFILTLILFTSCNTSDDVSSVTLTSTSDRIEEQIESQELRNVYEKVNIIRKLLKKNMNNQPDERK